MATLTTTVVISDQDRADADTFLSSFLTDTLPAGDFAKGSFLRDITVSAMAYTIAYLKAQSLAATNRTALKLIQSMTPGVDRDQAADDALSNWFLTRKSGNAAQGNIIVHLSQDADVTIPLKTRFFYNATTIFTPNYTTDQVFPQASIVHVPDATNAIADRYIIVNVIAQNLAANTNVTPATWLTYDKFSPYITKVESLATFTGGADPETTDSLLARAKDSISIRDLNSTKSIRSTVLNTFTGFNDVVVVGAGDPEMQRDIVTPIGGLSQLHTGGYTDAYLLGSVAPAVYEAATGAAFTDPRPEITILTDASVGNFTATVTPGMILNVTNALPGEPSLFTIASVYPGYIAVASRNPFPALRTGVNYSIGAVSPGFTDAIASSTTGVYTNQLQQANQILLPAQPVYNINKVSYVNTGGTRITLTRSNTAPLSASTNYSVSFPYPQLTHSALQLGFLTVPSSIPANTTIRVEYDTVSGFSSVHSYMADPFNRISCGNVLSKGLHPVYLSMNVGYRLKARASGLLDTVGAGVALANYINTFPATETFAVSDVAAFLQANYPVIGSIQPMTINYTLIAPTGITVPYSTTDKVLVNSSYETTSPALLPNPLAYGISTRTTIFLTNPTLISFTQVT